MNLYLTEPGMILRKKGGKYIVEKDDIVMKEIPGNLVEAINIYSGATITSKCISHLILNNIYIFWFNASNILTGYIENIENLRSETILKQILIRSGAKNTPKRNSLKREYLSIKNCGSRPKGQKSAIFCFLFALKSRIKSAIINLPYKKL